MTYLPATRKEIHLDQATEQLAGVVQLRTNKKTKGIIGMMRVSVDYDDKLIGNRGASSLRSTSGVR